MYNELSTATVTNSYIDGATMEIGTSAAPQNSIFFGSGEFTCSSSCDAGQYGNCSTMEPCSSCEVDVCLTCPPGKWGHKSGATSEEDGCTVTDEGYYTTLSGATAALLCGSGQYVTTDADDTSGSGVTVGGTHCVAWYD